MAPEGGFIDKQVTNRCKGALVRSVLSSSVLLGPIGAVVAKWIESRTCNPKITGSSLMLGVGALLKGLTSVCICLSRQGLQVRGSE